METSDSLRFAGQTITFSFYARAGANYSPTSSLLGLRLGSGTGTDQNFLTGGYTGNVNLIDTTQTITTTWTRYSFTVAVGSTANELGLFFYSTPTGTAGANDWYEITGVQVELGSVATTFKRAGGGTIQGELAACQRYYVRFNAGNGYGNVANSGYTVSATQVNAFVLFPTQLRTIPTSIDSANISYLDTTGTTGTVTSPSSAASGVNFANVQFATTGATGSRYCWFRDSAGAGTGYLGFSAEL
jgi:hypothetical protein